MDSLPETGNPGDKVWIMSAPCVGWQYEWLDGIGWYPVAGMNCPYVPLLKPTQQPKDDQ